MKEVTWLVCEAARGRGGNKRMKGAVWLACQAVRGKRGEAMKALSLREHAAIGRL
jgi:hypothetical protein